MMKKMGKKHLSTRYKSPKRFLRGWAFISYNFLPLPEKMKILWSPKNCLHQDRLHPIPQYEGQHLEKSG